MRARARTAGTAGTAAGAAGSPALRAGATAALAAGLFLMFRALIPSQFADPFTRHDDYPPLLALGDLYWWKTIAKGRWVTWAWSARGAAADPPVLFALYMGAVCVFAAATAAGVARRGGGVLVAVPLGLALALMPQIGFISSWYAATFPAAVLLALYALLAAFGSRRAMLWGLVALVPPAAMAHTSYPLMMLMVAAMAGRPGQGRWEALGPPAAFLAGLALAAIVVLGLGLAVHGHLGLRTDVWLDERAPGGIGAIPGNVGLALGWLARMWYRMCLSSMPLALALLAGAGLAAVTVLSGARRDRAALLRLALAAAVAVGIGAAPTLLRGIETPARATGHLWMAAVAPFALAAGAAAPLPRRAVFAAGLVGLSVWSSGYWTQLFESHVTEYQARTRALAARIAAETVAEPARALVVAGQVHALPWAEVLQYGSGYAFRLELLTGLETRLCDAQRHDLKAALHDPEAARSPTGAIGGWRERSAAAAALCAEGAAGLAALAPYPGEPHLGEVAPGVLGLRLPEAAR